MLEFWGKLIEHIIERPCEDRRFKTVKYFWPAAEPDEFESLRIIGIHYEETSFGFQRPSLIFDRAISAVAMSIFSFFASFASSDIASAPG